jgi:hypothetical protein
VIICPCCGFRFEGDLRMGCEACGARAVGDPLPRPERELPGYGRSLLLVITGTLMVLGFLAEMIFALAQRIPLSFGFWSWIAAAETAAWRLKWISIPITMLVLWGGGRIYKSMMESPERFVGTRQARRALMASALVSLTIATLIGVTVPARLRHRKDAIMAELKSQVYRIERAQLEYRALNHTLATYSELKELPDPDGSLAAALANIDPADYKTTADVAIADKAKPRTLPGAVLRDASVNPASDEPPAVAVSFTNYELHLRGHDKILGTDYDLVVHDGAVVEAFETRPTSPTPDASPEKP